MNAAERMKIIRLIEKIEKDEEYARRMSVVNVSHYKTKKDDTLAQQKMI